MVTTDEQQQSRTEWMKQYYNHQYENWVPWMEDQYLKWFTKDNKTSYATKQQLDKGKVTGIEQVDQLQDGVNNLVAGQVGQGGLSQPLGDMVSKEGVNRVERGGKDDKGRSLESQGPLGGYGDAATGQVKGAGEGAVEGVKGAGGYLSGWMPGSKK